MADLTDILSSVGNVSQGLSNIGNAVTDLYSSQGSADAAQSYGEASAVAAQNVGLAEQATAIQEAQESRQIYQTIGTQQADVAGAGMSASGSALDLLASSQSQGALTKALTAEQGDITANAYSEQSGLYAGLARSAAATASGQSTAGTISGLVGTAQTGVGLYNLYSKFTSAGGTLTATQTADAAAADEGMAAGADAGTALLESGGAAAATDVAATTAFADAGVADAGAAAADAGAAAEGGSILGSIGDAIGSVLASVVCTELHRQGRFPARWYVHNARDFAARDAQIKRGYYFWAIPAVQHLRTHPHSLLSNFLEWLFNARGEFVAARAGSLGARRTFSGLMAFAGMHAVCWVLSRTVAKRFDLLKGVRVSA